MNIQIRRTKNGWNIRPCLLISCYNQRWRAVQSYMESHSRLYASYRKKGGEIRFRGVPQDVLQLVLKLQDALEHKKAIACGYAYIKGGMVCRRVAAQARRDQLPTHITQEEILELGRLYRMPEYNEALETIRELGHTLRNKLQKYYAENLVNKLYYKAFEMDLRYGDLTMMYFAVIGYLDALVHLKQRPSRAYTRMFIKKFAY